MNICAASGSGDGCDCGKAQSQLMSSMFETYQSEFRRNGWNVAGANLLSMSCWIAEQNFIYVRPCLSLLDFVFAIVFAAVVGSIVGGLAWTFNPIRNDVTTLWYAGTVGFFIGSISGGGYLLRKVSHWQPMAEIIRTKMDRTQQRDLVTSLLAVCAEQHLDPERPETLFPTPTIRNEKMPNGQFVFVLLDFFKKRLRMQQ